MQREEVKFEMVKADKNGTDKLVEYSVNLAWETEAKKLDAEETRKSVLDVLEKGLGMEYFFAVSEGKTIGQLALTIEFSALRNRWSKWFQTVYVETEYRGRRVFTNMFKQILEKGKEEGLLQLKLYAEVENERALKTYEKMGMHRRLEVMMVADSTFPFGSRVIDLANQKENLQKYASLNQEQLDKVEKKADLKFSRRIKSN